MRGPGPGPGLGHHHAAVGQPAVGDVDLAPVDDPVLAVLPGRGPVAHSAVLSPGPGPRRASPDALEVAARVWLRHGDAGDAVARGHGRDVALLLLPRAVVGQVRHHDRAAAVLSSAANDHRFSQSRREGNPSSTFDPSSMKLRCRRKGHKGRTP